MFNNIYAIFSKSICGNLYNLTVITNDITSINFILIILLLLHYSSLRFLPLSFHFNMTKTPPTNPPKNPF